MWTLWIAAALAAPPALSPGEVPADVAEAAVHARNLPLAERIAAISSKFLNVPYLHDPEGEGGGNDPDPPGRYDVFDCLTFVEEVLSLSLAADPTDAGVLRRALRYGDGPVDYAHRRHFMEAEWLPGAIDAGFLRDAAADYGETITLSKSLTPELWASWRGRARFALPDDRLPTGTMTLHVLPLATAVKVASKIKPGSLVTVVRIDRAGVPYWITHLGFVLPGPAPVLRHASHMASAMRVQDHDLGWYIRNLGTWPNWPVAGIAIFEPIEQGPPRRAP